MNYLQGRLGSVKGDRGEKVSGLLILSVHEHPFNPTCG